MKRHELDRIVKEEVARTTELKPTPITVYLDGEATKYTGVSFGEVWNGAEVVWFPIETIKKILKEHKYGMEREGWHFYYYAYDLTHSFENIPTRAINGKLCGQLEGWMWIEA